MTSIQWRYMLTLGGEWLVHVYGVEGVSCVYDGGRRWAKALKVAAVKATQYTYHRGLLRSVGNSTAVVQPVECSCSTTPLEGPFGGSCRDIMGCTYIVLIISKFIQVPWLDIRVLFCNIVWIWLWQREWTESVCMCRCRRVQPGELL